MKRAFTLIEMMIVVAVIAILTGILFRLMGVGEDAEKRNITVARMQRLENCLSGYYAAFGSYPPVELEGRSRNYRYEVNPGGIQQTSRNPQNGGRLNYTQVEAACRSQPIAMMFPFGKGQHEFVRECSKLVTKKHNMGMAAFANPIFANLFDALVDPSMLNSKRNYAEWTEIQVFQFGLMSYLLPRYLVMMKASDQTIYDKFAQWYANNSLPCRLDSGSPYLSWGDLADDLKKNNEAWKIAVMPTQQVCLRWLPNLEKCCRTAGPGSRVIHGIDIDDGVAGSGVGCNVGPMTVPRPFFAGNSQTMSASGSQMYVLDCISMCDGWDVEFFYYSPAPYQGYRLWSAGPNGKTFPPWASEEEIDGLSEANSVRNWIADDIVHMSH